MGVVQRQSIKNSIINYLGIAVGGLSTLFVYPLDWDLYGTIQFSLSAAILFSAFFSLGSHSLVNKYFPYFKRNDIKGFLSVVMLYSFINIILISVLLFLFRVPFLNLLEFGGFNIEQINKNLFIILPISILLVFITVFRLQSYNFKRIVYPDIISNFSVKLVAPTIVLLYYFSIVNFKGAGWILVIYHLIVAIALAVYLKTLNGLDFNSGAIKKVKKTKHWEMIQYMLYGAMNHIGNILVYKIDIVMIGLLLSATKVGYYSIFLFLTVAIEIPTNAVQRIVSPMISESFENKDMANIQKLYSNTSVNLFIIGIVLFSAIWFNMELFFKIMTHGEDLIIYKSVFLLLALTKIFEMITSVNFHIIAFSKHYRVNTVFILILAIVNIFLNYWLIGRFDIIGAAISTAISMLLFNLLKTIFIVIRFKMHPFTKKYILLFIFLIFSIFAPMLLPEIFNSILFSLFITVSFIGIFTVTIYKLKLSLDINHQINRYLGRK